MRVQYVRDREVVECTSGYLEEIIYMDGWIVGCTRYAIILFMYPCIHPCIHPFKPSKAFTSPLSLRTIAPTPHHPLASSLYFRQNGSGNRASKMKLGRRT